MGDLQIRIEGFNLPGSSCGPSPDVPAGYRNIHVGVQRKNRPGELLHLVPADAPSATWTLDSTVVATPDGYDINGPHVQGPPGGRFIYLSWGTVDERGFTMFRRAKLWLNAIANDVVERAMDAGALVGRLGLTDGKGNPRCAAVRPPLIEWEPAAPKT